MILWMSVEGEAEIADLQRPIRNKIEKQINQWLEKYKYTNDNLNTWDVIIILRDDKNFDEITKYSKKKKETDFRLVVDYNLFKTSNDNQRVNLILDMLIRSLEILKSKGVTDLQRVIEFLITCKM